MITVKVKNMTSHKGNKIANQFVIETEEGTYFQSYDSVIAFIPNNDGMIRGVITLDSVYWDYSVTTGKYRNMFLGECKAETKEKIAEGQYKLANLN